MAMKLKTEMAATRERGAMNTDIYTHQYTRTHTRTVSTFMCVATGKLQ